MELEAALDVVPSCVCLMVAPEAGPVQRVFDGSFGLVSDVEQASDLGDGEGDHPAAGWLGGPGWGGGGWSADSAIVDLA